MPKKVHYVWVGGKPLPQLAKYCIHSWQNVLSDYEIILWDEENSLMDHSYVKTAYEKKKWAFASDYIRFWVLYNHGGIYLDTDTEVLKPLDRFLNDAVFFGKTSSDGYISCGIIGAVPRHPFIKAVLDEYDRMGEAGEMATSPQTVTRVYGNYPNKEEIKVYEPKYFYPCNAGEKCTRDMLKDAYTNHHWDESWVSFRQIRKIARRLGLISLIKYFYR